MISEFIEWIKAFLAQLGFEDLVNSEEAEAEALILLFGIGAISSVGTLLWKGFKWWYQRYQQQQLKKDLLPYYTVADIKLATQYYIPTRFQNVPPSRHSELAISNKTVARQALLRFFLRDAFRPDQNDQRFYMLLAGSGMGKTTFMLNLYLRYIQRRRFIRNSYEIYLFPLGAPNILKRIEQIPEPEKTILLLDGLDEDTLAVRNYKARLKHILETVQEFRTVVFTCRTQFFPSDAEVPHVTHIRRYGGQQGFQAFDQLYISPFNHRDINRYLNKRFRWYHFAKKRKAKEIIAYSPNLMVRPMVLSNIDDLLEAPVDYYFTSHLYEAMIQKWIEREMVRVDPDRQASFSQELYRFSEGIALNMYDHRKHRGGLFIGEKEIRPFAEKHRIQLEEIEMRSRSLLNRDAQGQYKFAHKSILEYFLAKIMVQRPTFAAQFSFDGMDQARVFYREMCLNRTTLPLFKELKESGMGALPNTEAKSVDQFSPTEVQRIEKLTLTKAKRIEAVGPLIMLRELCLDHTQVKEMAPLEGLVNLTQLSMVAAPVSDIRPLSALEKLETLYMDGTQIRILDPINRLSALQTLSFSHTEISQLDPIQGLDKLVELGCNRTAIKDLNPLRRLRNLKVLEAFRTQVATLSPLRDLEDLEHLNVGRSKLKNISAIRGLQKLRYLNLDNAQLGDWTIIKHLNVLEVFSANQSNFAHLEILTGLMHLKELYLNQCPIENLRVLRELKSLQILSLRQTPVPSLDILKAMPELAQIYVSRAHLSEPAQKTIEAALPDVMISTSDMPKVFHSIIGKAAV